MRSCVLILVLWVSVTAAPAAESPLTDADRMFFEKQVRPLLAERCHRCHSAEAKKRRGGLLLDSREAVLGGGDTGPAVVAGRPEDSLLIRAVRPGDGFLRMPPKNPLSKREVAVLEEWVRRGVPFPGARATNPADRTIDIARGRRFWSFRPLRATTPPTDRHTSWPNRRIDAFVLFALEERGLSPAAPAGRRELIRRASFDLIGLPPSPDEVEAFVRDDRPDAYERLIERLLASPAHGERWARFWLDLARYCDEAEPWADRQGVGYVYRDWVVRAFNEDLPYDQFVQRQLAADLIPGTQPEDRAALGFLGLSPVYWKELKLDQSVIKTVVAEEWEERIDALGRTFLGLTVACARCHDHKFDPITKEDYYALAGVFASIRQSDLSLLPDAEADRVARAREQIKALEAQIAERQKQKPLPPEAAEGIAQWKGRIQQIREETPHFDMPLVPGVSEASLHVLPDGPHRTKVVYRPGEAQDVAVQVRGSPTSPGPVVPRRFLAVLSPGTPEPFQAGSGRRELAEALVTDAAPLAARVMVNRVWKHHFGKALVETPSDFGAQGERPSHPDLLDDLAFRFVRSGWSLKWLHREIMLSSTYRQSSTDDGSRAPLDPDNRLLGRMSRRRLEVEAWRDAILAVTGSLQHQIGGPPGDLGDPGNTRRTLYGRVKRRDLNDLLRLHDVPDATVHSPTRVPTTTPLQQLYVLNSPFMQRQAEALAARVESQAPAGVEGRVRWLYHLLYGRAPTDREVRLAVGFLTGGQPGGSVRKGGWTRYAQVLLGSNELMFID